MKGRSKKATGGVNEADQDLRDKPTRRNNAPAIEGAAEERKSGGRAKRKAGGMVPGEAGKCHAGRKPRMSGGGLFSAAAKGTPPKGHKVDGTVE